MLKTHPVITVLSPVYFVDFSVPSHNIISPLATLFQVNVDLLQLFFKIHLFNQWGNKMFFLPQMKYSAEAGSTACTPPPTLTSKWEGCSLFPYIRSPSPCAAANPRRTMSFEKTNCLWSYWICPSRILFYSLGVQVEETHVVYLNYKLDFIFRFRILTHVI